METGLDIAFAALVKLYERIQKENEEQRVIAQRITGRGNIVSVSFCRKPGPIQMSKVLCMKMTTRDSL